jgi:hypothetical protein
LIALHLGICLLICKYYPLTPAIGQRSLEDGSLTAAQLPGVADMAVDGPATEFNPILLDNFLFVVFVIYVNVGVGMFLEFEDILWSRMLAFAPNIS